MYESETKFVSYIKSRLNNAGFDVQRLESHSTGNGIPDMFVQGFGTDCFIELKNVKQSYAWVEKHKFIQIAWRPGQIAWAWRYELTHCGKKHTWLWQAYKDAIVCILVSKDSVSFDPDNGYGYVLVQDNPFLFKFSTEEFSALDLRKFLLSHQ